jgi:two-component system LytT family response regulator
VSVLRTVIADDERLGRQKIRLFLAAHRDVDVVAECATGPEASAEIRAKKPDLVFLDVRMPGSDGFDVLRRVKTDLPAIIFVTAHDEYALAAFDVEAVDYLLKPFDRRRFNEALRRARKRIESGALPLPKDWTAALEELARRKDRGQYWSRFAVRARDRMFFVPAGDVDWIGSEGKYVRLHVGTAAGHPGHLLRAAMSDVEAHLDPSEFARIHRGTVVNLKKVVEMYRGFGGNHVVVLSSGRKLTLSRRYRARLKHVGGLT